MEAKWAAIEVRTFNVLNFYLFELEFLVDYASLHLSWICSNIWAQTVLDSVFLRMLR